MLKVTHVCLAALFAMLSMTVDDVAAESEFHDQLIRLPYHSAATGAEREYFVWLPADYERLPDKKWPIMLFLHGNGERGDGLAELDYVLKHGPLMEAWIQNYFAAQAVETGMQAWTMAQNIPLLVDHRQSW